MTLRVSLIALACAFVAMPSIAAPCAGFVDVEDTSTFCPNVAWLKNRSITLGCTDAEHYCPNDSVSRLSMAAFMNRLGDAVLPPSVIWVAPIGGTFQQIQAAIAYAATRASPGNPILIRIAPGTYVEKIVLAPNVLLEGSGKRATVITSSQEGGTVVATSPFHLRSLSVRNQAANAIGISLAWTGDYQTSTLQGIEVHAMAGSVSGTATAFHHESGRTVIVDSELAASNGATAIGLRSGGDVAVRDSSIFASGATTNYGVYAHVYTSATGSSISAAGNWATGYWGSGGVVNSTVSAQGDRAYAIHVPSNGFTLDGSRISSYASITSYALYNQSGIATISSSSMSASGPGSNHAVHSGGLTRVMGSSLIAELGAENIAAYRSGGQLNIATTWIPAGAIVGGAQCVGNYDASFAPIAGCP